MRQHEQRKLFAQAFRSVIGTDKPLDAHDKSGKNPEYIRQISQGKRLPSWRWIREFCDGYGVDPTPLLKAAGYDLGIAESGSPAEEAAEPHAEYVTFGEDPRDKRVRLLEERLEAMDRTLNKLVDILGQVARVSGEK